MPMGEEFHRQQCGVVSPMLEQRLVLMMKDGEKLARVTGRAREQDHVMGTLDHIDRIDLHKAEAPHERQHFVSLQRLVRTLAKRVLVEKQPPCIRIGDDEFGHWCKLS